MFIDASAIVAILNEEPGYEMFEKRIEEHTGKRFVSAMVMFESAAALARIASEKIKAETKPSPEMVQEAFEIVKAFVSEIDAHDVPITSSIGKHAIDAAATYGRLVGHKAQLNFGDCFSYACAKAHRLPLMFKGNDFSQTDLA